MTRSLGDIVFLVLDAWQHRWAIDSESVISVLRRDDWHGATPLDLGARLGLGAPEAADERIIVVRGPGDAEVPLRAPGRLVLRQLPADAVRPLPAGVRSPTNRELILGVVLAKNERGMLLLDPLGLAPGVQPVQGDAS